MNFQQILAKVSQRLWRIMLYTSPASSITQIFQKLITGPRAKAQNLQSPLLSADTFELLHSHLPRQILLKCKMCQTICGESIAREMFPFNYCFHLKKKNDGTGVILKPLLLIWLSGFICRYSGVALNESSFSGLETLTQQTC